MPLWGRTPDIIDYLFAFMVGAFLWTGATQALAMSRMRAKLPGLSARRLARPALGVPADLPLAEAVRQAQDVHAGSLIVVSPSGQPIGVVNEDAVASTPVERRPWVTCGALARRVESDLSLSADLTGEDLLRAMSSSPSPEYLLTEPDGSVYGVLVTKDVDAAFAAA
jgi:hypothetical protein